MTSAVTICNLALAHIGAAQQVASIDPPDGTALAGYCARFYPPARREMLEHPWRFALRRTALALTAGGPPPGWLFAYALPSNCIAPQRLIPPAAQARDDGYEFEVIDNVLYTNVPSAVLSHTVDVTDSTRFTPAFVAALALHLAGYLAGSVIKGRDGAALRQRLQEEARMKAELAAARDANAQQDPRREVSDIEAARA